MLILVLCAGVLLIAAITYLNNSNTLKQTRLEGTQQTMHYKPTAQIHLISDTSSNSASIQTSPYQNFTVQIQIIPTKHKISVVHPVINYNSTLLRVKSINVNQQAFPMELQNIKEGNKPGMLSLTDGINLPLDNAITNPTTFATITFEALKTDNKPTVISFNKDTYAYSVAPSDGPSTNVIASSNSLSVTIK